MLLYTESPLKFAFSKDITDLRKTVPKTFGILGVPFDSTSTYMTGARFGPNMVREASYNLERYNLSQNKLLNTPFYDLGNLHVINGNFRVTCNYLESTIKEILKFLGIMIVTSSITYLIGFLASKILGAGIIH